MQAPAVSSSAPAGRLRGKVALVTGAAGNIGREICERYLREGARVAMLGRDESKLAAARSGLLEAVGLDDGAAIVVSCDGGDPEQTRRAIERVVETFGPIDILVNNAGSAGPRQPLEQLPFTRAELDALRASGSADSETVGDAVRNTFGIAWNMVRAAAPHLRPGSSIVNVSTIFSRTKYYGRTAYVVPKAALNTWSRRLSYELGAAGVRVNTVLPGPIASERIETVFASMDRMRDAASGTTASEFLNMMTLTRQSEGKLGSAMPQIADVAGTIVFLGSDESVAINGHNFEVTHGMVVRQESRSTFVSRPALRTVDASGRKILIIAGDQIADALEVGRANTARGATVVVALATGTLVTQLRAQLDPHSGDTRISAIALDRNDANAVETALQALKNGLQGVVVLPAHDARRFHGPLASAPDDDVAAFLEGELTGAIGIARALARHWRRFGCPTPPPRVVFTTNGDDGADNVYADILRSAQEQLARSLRDETEVDARAGRRSSAVWANQIVRFTNGEDESVRFAAAWATKLLHIKRRIPAINLYLPEALEEDTGAGRAMLGDIENLIGLHLGKVALITGGSAGIGGQIGRLLAIAGASVVLAARDEEKLRTVRDEMIAELEAIGYDRASERVEIVGGIDVADLASLETAIARTIERFGRVDYLVNNAGVAGAEQMVVDMTLDEWRRTLRANLVSNFAAMARLVPEMKRLGSGYIVNVSSYFGGEKFVAVSYPNRADYAVSKAGQRAIVETMAGFVGPEIQLNAIAPGPVDGVRLRGSSGPGLYERRGRLILENQRLNALYAAAIEAVRAGYDAHAFVARAMTNSIPDLLRDHETPATLRRLCEKIASDKTIGGECSFYDTLMNRSIATKFVARLQRGGYLGSDVPTLASEPAEPFFSRVDVSRHAEKVRSGVLKLLHLQKMPTETEVALATIFFLADRAISGETFHPSGGLSQERSVTERELFGRSKDERVEGLRDRTVWIVGEHPVPQLARSVQAYVEECHVGRVVLMTRTQATADHVLRRVPEGVASRVSSHVVGMDIEGGLNAALAQYGRPVAVASFPMGSLPTTIFEGRGGMDGAAFETLLEEQVTNHFRVSRVASLFDGARLIFVSPEVPLAGTQAEFALASFVKTTLHALTATAAVENERLVHEVPVNQINPTRQRQSDEPRNSLEQDEKMERFARALILESGPLPTAVESRYRASVYRGLAITV